jgi:uncharacterized protein
MDVLQWVLFFAAGVFTGVLGTLTGGAGMITIPAMIFLGLSPQASLGTNFLASIGFNGTGWIEFHRKKMVDYRVGVIVCLPSLLGLFVGSHFVFQVNPAVMKKLIAVITLLLLLFITLRPNIGVEQAKRNVTPLAFVIGILLSFVVGIYTGVYGAVAGTFLSYILILVFGQTFLVSAATRKITFTVLCVVGTVLFGMNGAVNYVMGLVLFVGLSIGAYFGAHYSDRIGNVWVKRLFFLVVLVMSIKLIL